MLSREALTMIQQVFDSKNQLQIPTNNAKYLVEIQGWVQAQLNVYEAEKQEQPRQTAREFIGSHRGQ